MGGVSLLVQGAVLVFTLGNKYFGEGNRKMAYFVEEIKVNCSELLICDNYFY